MGKKKERSEEKEAREEVKREEEDQRRERNESRVEERKRIEEDRREKIGELKEHKKRMEDERREEDGERVDERKENDELSRERNEKRGEERKRLEEDRREKKEKLKEHKKRMEVERREEEGEKVEQMREQNERRVEERKGRSVDPKEDVSVRKEISREEEQRTVDKRIMIKRELGTWTGDRRGRLPRSLDGASYKGFEVVANVLGHAKEIYDTIAHFKKKDKKNDDSKKKENYEKYLQEIKKFEGLERNHEDFTETYKVINKIDSRIYDDKPMLRVISKTVAKNLDFHYEMKSNLKDLREELRKLEMKDSLSGIQSSMEFLDETRSRVGKEGFRVEEGKGEKGAEAVEAWADRLYEHLREVLRSEHAVPRDAADSLGLQALRVLCDGATAYGNIAFPLVLQHYASLADFHHLRNREEFNKFHSSIKMTFQKFKERLLGKDHSLIADVSEILVKVKNMNISNENFNSSECLDRLSQLKSGLEAMRLPLIDETPKDSLTMSLDCGGMQTPLGDWRDGAKVYYALQYKDEDFFSKVGPWTQPFRVAGRAAPTVNVPVDEHRRTRLVFRKFDEGKADLVAVLTDHYKTKFKDVNRDLYNAASSPNHFDAIREVASLEKCGAKLSGTFEWMDAGGTLFHAAARSGNVLIAEKLNTSEIDINAKDKNGYAAIHIAAMSGSEDFVRLLMKKKANVNVRTENELLTPLHLASSKGYYTVVDELLSSDTIDVNAREKNGFTPFHFAVYGGPLVLNSFMKYNKTDLNAKSEAGLTALHLTSVSKKYLDIAKDLLNSTEVDVNAKTVGNLTALHFATVNENKEMVELLVNHELIDMNSKSAGGWTPLHFAIANEINDITSQILKASKTDVNSKAFYDFTPLHVAAIEGNKDGVVLLLKNQALIEAAAESGLRALHLAAITSSLPVVSVLLDEGVDVNSKSEDGVTPLLAAVMSTDEDSLTVAKELIGRGASRGEDLLQILAASPHRIDLIKFAFEKCPDCVNNKNHLGESVLHSAARAGDLSAVRTLVESKASLSATNNLGETPLHYAALSGKQDVVEYLIESGADINAKGWNGQTVLHYAVQSGNVSLVDYLRKKKGCDIDADTMLHQKPLHLAAQKGSLDVVEYLLENSANSEVKDWNNRTVLHFAVESENVNLVTYLLNKKNMNVNDRTKDGQTPLHYAAESGNTDMAKLLLDRGALIGARNSHQDTPLHSGAKRGRLEVTKFLSSMPDVDLNDKGHNNNTVLHYAVRSGNSDLVQFLCGKKVEINSRSNSLETPLHNAAEVGKLDIVKYLVKEGADISAVDGNKETVLHHAVLSGNLQLVKYLVEEKGADLEAKTGEPKRGTFFERELGELARQEARVRGRRTPLHFAAAVGELEIARYLVQRGASLSARDQAEATPAQLAVELGHTRLFELLAAERLDERNPLYGKTYLQSAAGSGNLEAVGLLGGKGVVITERNAFNKTALHYAVEKGRPDVVKYLVDKSADTLARDWDGGRTPLELARAHNNTEIVKQLGSGRVERSVGLPAEAETQSTLLLADTIIRKITGRRFVARDKRALSPGEALSHALTVTEGFEQALLEAASAAGVSPHRLELDLAALRREVVQKLAAGRAGEVAGLLRATALGALPDSRPGVAGRLGAGRSARLAARLDRALPRLLHPLLHRLSS